MSQKQKQVEFLAHAAQTLGMNATGIVALLDGVDYATYGKWARGERRMSSSAKTAINMLLCMKAAQDMKVPAFDVWRKHCATSAKQTNQEAE